MELGSVSPPQILSRGDVYEKCPINVLGLVFAFHFVLFFPTYQIV